MILISLQELKEKSHNAKLVWESNKIPDKPYVSLFGDIKLPGVLKHIDTSKYVTRIYCSEIDELR